jgi:BirA family biotin operon repressor/biotin-[acetyl-CoA-carboxylase] ligase
MLHFAEVLTLLDHTRHCSGQDLAEKFHVTRATIHNCILRIESLGIGVERVRGLGYRLSQPLDLLNNTDILSKLHPQVADKLCSIQCLQEIDSTNHYASTLALPEAGQFSVVLAEMQTAGKGRRGRNWVSPYAANIYMSVLWPLQRPLHEAGALSPLLAIGMLQALQSLGVEGLGLKWPNDIYCQNKKLAGLLIECSGEISGGCKMVVGMGVNVLMSQYENIDISQEWTDINSNTLDWNDSRNQVASNLLNNTVLGLAQFEKNNCADLSDQWAQWDVMKDKQVDIHSAQQIRTGIARGINASGCLLLETSQGLEKISAGDVSMRGHA